MKIETSYGTLVLLPDCPLVGATEKLEFLTDVHESINGKEERIPLRDKARQTLGFSYVWFRQFMAAASNQFWGGIRSRFAIPMAFEYQPIPDMADSDFISFDTAGSIADLRPGLALIRHSTGFAVVEIEAVEPDGYQLADSITVSAAKIVPLRVCIVDGDIATEANGLQLHAAINFVVEEGPEYTGEVPEQYKGDDLYFMPLLLEGDTLPVAISQQQSIVDSITGTFEQFSNWDKPKPTKNLRTLLKGKQQLRDYKRWLFRRKGRLNAFWLPTYERNINIVSTGIVANWFDVQSDSYMDFAQQRKHIAVQIDGIWQPHEITDVVQSGPDTARLTVSPALYVEAADIQRISYLGLYRLNADAVTIKYHSAKLAEVVAPIIEI